MPFASLGLSPRLLEGVAALGYADPTPIQSQAVPHVLAGRDVVGIAQTGTGKTAAFVLPMLQRTPQKQGIRALVVTPTRELALQIQGVMKEASASTRHRSAVVFGGVPINAQIAQVRRGIDVLVACPGRLLDLHARGVVDLRKVETLVLDEADRMLDMGFWPDVKRILALLPAKRQTLLFSATMDPRVKTIVDGLLTDPVRVEVTPASTPVDRIDQVVHPVSRTQKTDLLVTLLNEGDHTRTIVFARTKHRADRLARQLTRAGVGAAPIHGDRSQGQRQKALDAFKRGHTPVLVATDVVARGIDVSEVSHVVNYDLPNMAEDYVHRIGRTARAGASGAAISFCDADELDKLHQIEKLLGQPIACEDVDGFLYDRERVVPDPDRSVKPAGPPQRQGDGAKARRSSRRGGKGRAGNVQPKPKVDQGQSPSQGQAASGQGNRSQTAQGKSQPSQQPRGGSAAAQPNTSPDGRVRRRRRRGPQQ